MTVMRFRYNPTDPRLGRHVRHDTRSALYGVPELPRAAIKSVRWERHIPILDQGQIGSCVPNNIPEHLGTDAVGYTGVTSVTVPKMDVEGKFAAGSVWSLDEDFALQFYRLVTRLDSYAGQWEPDDTGSDGLTMAKAMVMTGLADRYHHAFSYKGALSALMRGPVSLGTVWYQSMFEPKPDGEVVVDPSSGVAGGHEWFAREFDADNDRLWLDQTWGEGWGLDGRAWISGAGVTTLLKAQGDVTQPHLVGIDPLPKNEVTDQQLADVFEAWKVTRNLH